MLTETARDRGPASPQGHAPASSSPEVPGSPTYLQVGIRGASAAMLHSLVDVLDTLPAVRAVTVLSNDANSRHDVSGLRLLHQRCAQRRLCFSVDFPLDGAADACAALGRQPTSLGPVLEVSRSLRIAGVRVRWLVPVLPDLAYRLEPLFSLAMDERVEPILVPPWLAHPAGGSAPERLDPDAERFVRDFIAYRLLDEERPDLSGDRQAFYETLLDSLGTIATVPPGPPNSVAVLDADVSQARWTLRHDARPALAALIDPADPVDAGDPASAEHAWTGTPDQATEVAGVLAEGVRAVLQWAGTTLVRAGRVRREVGERPLPRVLIIGAYGGEHIGDAAILGGVLLRIHRRYGTREAILVSQRPDHTRHLVPMLDTPVTITVEDYQQSTVGALLKKVDGVVFAGGPLMDLPKQLVKHLYTVSLARRADKPFVLEGIGAGPFVRWASAWIARRLVLMADRIAVRTSDDGRAPLVRGLRPEVGRDPAFDYLATRGAELTRLPQVDREWLDRLLKDTEGRVTVGLNLRPIRPDYTTDTSADRRVEYTRFVEARFEERLAEAMRLFVKASDRPPCFIFFPMNAIQFGLSDLRSAYRLRRLLRGDVDFRVWEGDASLDGIVALLGRLDVAITMRFHATIFALARQRRVIGIDYRVGKRDKVAALLADVGRSDSCTRIDEMTTEWLLRRLSGHAG